jgi:hypothetical protein
MSLKKLQMKVNAQIPYHIALKKVDIWLKEEACFGTQNATTLP